MAWLEARSLIELYAQDHSCFVCTAMFVRIGNRHTIQLVHANEHTHTGLLELDQNLYIDKSTFHARPLLLQI